MSGDKKGTRKPAGSKGKINRDTARTGLSSGLIITILIAGLYSVFLVDTRLDTSLLTLMLSAFLVAAFLVFVFTVRSGNHRLKQQFSSLLYVFVGLSLLTLLWELLAYLKIVDVTTMSPAIWIATVGLVNGIASIIIIAAIAALEKLKAKDLYLTAGDAKVIPFAAVAFGLCAILGAGSTYYLFGGAALGMDKLAPIALAVLVFAALASVAEELWFRGLMLSKIIPILGESRGNIYQALVFGVFEAVMFYTLTGELSFMPAMFIIGAMTGYYWGRATLRSKSLISPMVLHAGFYLLILLPIMTGLAA
ncbi:CPBP family intramembrane glutamic endopeptidase [Methanocella sp. MCL-LM]|uniref:CPBP family intramembrane glutamic endopeptidase n=1 Tax=Methanocella sp. MCL-LM TaxID=3412035 RepID=UPI003C759AD9